MEETNYQADCGRVPPPRVGSVQGWGDPATARRVVRVKWVGPVRYVDGHRGNSYPHADGYEVTTVPATAADLAEYLAHVALSS